MFVGSVILVACGLRPAINAIFIWNCQFSHGNGDCPYELSPRSVLFACHSPFRKLTFEEWAIGKVGRAFQPDGSQLSQPFRCGGHSRQPGKTDLLTTRGEAEWIGKINQRRAARDCAGWRPDRKRSGIDRQAAGGRTRRRMHALYRLARRQSVLCDVANFAHFAPRRASHRHCNRRMLVGHALAVCCLPAAHWSPPTV